MNPKLKINKLDCKFERLLQIRRYVKSTVVNA